METNKTNVNLLTKSDGPKLLSSLEQRLEPLTGASTVPTGIQDFLTFYQDLVKECQAELHRFESSKFFEVSATLKLLIDYKDSYTKFRIINLGFGLMSALPDMEVESNGFVIFFRYNDNGKMKKMHMNFSSSYESGFHKEISLIATIHADNMHTELSCNSFAILGTITLTKVTPVEFIAQLRQILTRQHVVECHYCGKLIY